MSYGFDLSKLRQLHTLSESEACAFCVGLEGHLRTSSDLRERLELARSLPAAIGAFTTEVQMLLARIASLLADAMPSIPEDAHQQSRVVRASWLRVQLAAPTGAWREAVPAALADALEEMAIDELFEAEDVLKHCVASREERLQRGAIRLLKEGLDAGIADAAFGMAQVERLFAHAPRDVRRAAAALVAHPVVENSLSVHALRLALLALKDDDVVAEAVVPALARASRARELVEVVLDAARSDALRAAALVALGECMAPDDVDGLLDAACADPIALAQSCLQSLAAAHMRGVFLRAVQLPRVLALFVLEPSFSAVELVRITYTERAALVDLLTEIAPDDARWRKLAHVLAHVEEPRAPQLLGELLRRAQHPDVAEALISAAARCAGFADEAAVLAWLERLPRSALATLRVKGTQASADALLGSVRASSGLGSLRGEAGSVYYALADDKIEAHEELRYAPQSSEFARLFALGPPVCDEWSPGVGILALEQLGCHGDARHRRLAAEVFRAELSRCFEDKRRASASSIRDRADGSTPLERSVDALCVHMASYGERLIARGASIYPFAFEGTLSGQDLSQQVLFDWLDERPERHFAEGLLELLATLTIREPNLRRVTPWWRAREPEMRAAAVRVILAAGTAGVGFAFSLGSLADEPDRRVRRQALLAIAQHTIFGAEPIVREALADPNMNVRRTAAAALARVGNSRSIPALVGVLAHHDNQGLRDDCLLALEHCAGTSTTAVLLGELTRARDERTALLVLRALAPRLSILQVVRLCRGEGRVSQLMLAALGDAETFSPPVVAAVSVHLGSPSAAASLIEHAVARLLVEGFSDSAARALCAAASRDPFESPRSVECVRTHVHAWIRWALGLEGSEALLAQRLALRAATDLRPSEPTLPFDELLEVAQRLATTHPGEVLRWCGAVAGALSRPRQLWLLRVMRGLVLAPESEGLLLYRAMTAASAVLTERDLERCLAASRPEHIGTILAEAFRVSGAEAKALSQWNEDFEKRAPRSLREWQTWVSTARLATPAQRKASLGHVLEVRPLGLRVDGASSAEWGAGAAGRERLQRLQAGLLAADRTLRERAANDVLTERGVARELGAESVLRAFLRGEVAVPSRLLEMLAPHLRSWPSDAAEAEQARRLLPLLPVGHVRRWLPQALEAWQEAHPGARVLVEAANRRDLVDFAARRVEQGEQAFAQLLTPNERAEVLFASEGKDSAQTDVPEPADQRSSTALAEHATESRGDAAILLVKELIRRGPASEPFLLRLTTHAEWRVRNASLRGLSQVSSREVYLGAAVRMFAGEHKLAPLKRLARIVAHGRQHEAVPKLVSLLCASEAQRALAHESLLAFGPTVLPALEKARRGVRPDHLSRLEKVIAALRAAESE